MSKSKEEIIKAVDDLQKRVEELEASGDSTGKIDTDKYQAVLKETENLKAKIKTMEDEAKKKPEDSDFSEDW